MEKTVMGTNVYEEGKRDLVEKVKSNIDLEQLREYCNEQLGLQSIKHIDLQEGDIISENGDVMIKLDIDIRLPLSIFIDKEGKCVRTNFETDNPPASPEERVEEAGQQASSAYSSY